MGSRGSTDARAHRLAEWLDANREVRKAVVFVDDAAVADLVADCLGEALGPETVLRHRADRGVESRFEQEAEIRVFVCDEEAEEGLNLQKTGATVVHYDLPLSSHRSVTRPSSGIAPSSGIPRSHAIARQGRPT